jgi:hypothetical protein
VKALLRAIDRRYYVVAPAERLAALRILVGGFAVVLLLVSAPKFWALASFSAAELAPVGPLFWLEAPLAPGVVYGAFVACVLGGIAFTLGVGYGVVAPIFAALLLLLTTYRSSFGMKFHTENLLVLHVLLLAAAPAADAWRWRGGDAARATAAPAPHGRYGWALCAMSVVTVITYVLAGIAKIRNGGWEWVHGDLLRAQIAYDNVRKIELGSLHSPLGAAVVRVAWLFPILGWLTMAVELLAPVALLGRRWASGWALLAWGFHAGVLAVMMIGFPYPLTFIAYASLFRAERLGDVRPVRRLVSWLFGGSRSSAASARSSTTAGVDVDTAVTTAVTTAGATAEPPRVPSPKEELAERED